MSESGATAKHGKAFVQVLVIEDELVARRATAQGLREEGFRVMEAADGLAGLELATRETPDVVILDLRLPRLDGEHVLEKLRQSSDVPIIVVSAKRNEEDRIEVLNLGADDYIVKPFSLRCGRSQPQPVGYTPADSRNGSIWIGPMPNMSQLPRRST